MGQELGHQFLLHLPIFDTKNKLQGVHSDELVWFD